MRSDGSTAARPCADHQDRPRPQGCHGQECLPRVMPALGKLVATLPAPGDDRQKRPRSGRSGGACARDGPLAGADISSVRAAEVVERCSLDRMREAELEAMRSTPHVVPRAAEEHGREPAWPGSGPRLAPSSDVRTGRPFQGLRPGPARNGLRVGLTILLMRRPVRKGGVYARHKGSDAHRQWRSLSTSRNS